MDTERHLFTFKPENKQPIHVQRNGDLPGFGLPPYRFLGPLVQLNGTHVYATTVFGDIIQIVNDTTTPNPYKVILP